MLCAGDRIAGTCFSRTGVISKMASAPKSIVPKMVLHSKDGVVLSPLGAAIYAAYFDKGHPQHQMLVEHLDAAVMAQLSTKLMPSVAERNEITLKAKKIFQENFGCSKLVLPRSCVYCNRATFSSFSFLDKDGNRVMDLISCPHKKCVGMMTSSFGRQLPNYFLMSKKCLTALNYWSFCLHSKGVCKDLRIMIAKLIWASREEIEWEPVVTNELNE